MAVGAVHSASCAPALVAERIKAATGRSDLFVYLPPVTHDRVLGVLDQFDYFLFFSTSNLEVLGRVLVEAEHAKVPVLAADHAAAPELLPPSSLLDVVYHPDQEFHSHFDAPLGAIDVDIAANKIRRREIPHGPPPAHKVNRPEVLVAALTRRAADMGDSVAAPLAPAQRQFVQRLQWDGLTRYSVRQQAGPVIETLSNWFCALNEKAGSDFEARLAELELRSRFKERSRRFIDTSRTTRCDFTNLGGIDIELCNIAAFYPRFKVGKPAEDMSREKLI